jgi:toxin ParE1/3/4
MAKYIVTREAEEDIDEIIAYIAADNFEAAVIWYDRLLDLFRMLGENPYAGRLRAELQDELRCFPEQNYLIFYRKWAEKIAITRVLHSARDLEELFS